MGGLGGRPGREPQHRRRSHRRHGHRRPGRQRTDRELRHPVRRLAGKPDIAAPGDHIVAARAAGVPLDPFAVNSSYAELPGTSMAAPRVTGAAALLAQLHPTWKAAELKSALMGSALELEGVGVFAQGAGRVDVSRAIKQPVTAYPSSLNLGLRSYPHTDDKPITKQVTYRNDSSKLSPWRWNCSRPESSSSARPRCESRLMAPRRSMSPPTPPATPRKARTAAG
ncbi:S8 family serine peptidase [Kribbella qitaiheensis]|uniref:S8 family serine peptidase n=1 Tax=Kribbella qitaiheensis TaxID=1544730 RepID=A0A7G6WUW9_9ACTN|nr:S8 family serine peptidase [Kribbella qitaiheensis]